MSGFSRTCICMSVWSETRGRKWQHLVLHEWLPRGIVYLQLFNVLCKCMSNVRFHTTAADHPPANIHAAAGKHPCSAGWQEVRTDRDSCSLPPGPVRKQKVQNVNGKQGIKCCNFMCFNFMLFMELLSRVKIDVVLLENLSNMMSWIIPSLQPTPFS